MSNGEVKKVSHQDVQLVQDLIERCLQLYMNQKEVINTLLHQAKIEPSFTELVWQKLEEQNQEFFKAYHLRLILKDQILKFNELLETQAKLMRQISPTTAAASLPISDGSHVPLYNSQAMKLENTHQPAVAKSPGGLTNGGPLLHPCTQSNLGMPGFSRRDDVSSNHPATNVLDRHPVMPEVPVPSFIGEKSNLKPVNEPIVEPDSSLFGFLGQIPRNFSLSDLTADFSISSDILDSYSRSPYLATDTEFLNPHGNGDIQGDTVIVKGWAPYQKA